MNLNCEEALFRVIDGGNQGSTECRHENCDYGGDRRAVFRQQERATFMNTLTKLIVCFTFAVSVATSNAAGPTIRTGIPSCGRKYSNCLELSIRYRIGFSER